MSTTVVAKRGAPQRNTYNKKVKLALPDYTSFLCSNELLDNWRVHVCPIVVGMSSETCSAACIPRKASLESLLVEKKCVPSPYPAVFGCHTHGHFVQTDINNPHAEKYRMKFAAERIAANVTKSACSCKMNWLPRVYSFDSQCTHFEWHPRPVYYCAQHLAVHYCVKSTSNCNNCFCCVVSRTPCPFRCFFTQTDKKDNTTTCAISGITFSLSSRAGIVAIDPKGVVWGNIARTVTDLLADSFRKWIAYAKTVEYHPAMTISTRFNLFYKEHMYAGTIATQRKKVYFKIGMPMMARFIKEYAETNYQSIEWPSNFEDAFLLLWRSVILYLPHFCSIELMYAMVCHLSVERGLVFAKYGLLPLNKSYVTALVHLNGCKPQSLKNLNLSQYIFEFNVFFNSLRAPEQAGLAESLQQTNHPFFDFSTFVVPKQP